MILTNNDVEITEAKVENFDIFLILFKTGTPKSCVFYHQCMIDKVEGNLLIYVSRIILEFLDRKTVIIWRCIVDEYKNIYNVPHPIFVLNAMGISCVNGQISKENIEEAVKYLSK